MKLVVDASVAIKWFVPEDLADVAARWLNSTDSICAPDWIAAEFGNIVWKLLRRGEITRREAGEFLTGLGEVGLELSPSMNLFPAALDLAVELDQTVYDSLYLALAITRDWTLITADRKFYTAAKASAFASYIAWVGDEP
jgi:predicted nucleic acid-binding protein